jgi:hypothetical protein
MGDAAEVFEQIAVVAEVRAEHLGDAQAAGPLRSDPAAHGHARGLGQDRRVAGGRHQYRTLSEHVGVLPEDRLRIDPEVWAQVAGHLERSQRSPLLSVTQLRRIP